MDEEMKAMPDVKANLERIEALLRCASVPLIYIAMGSVVSGIALTVIAVKLYV